MINIEIEEIIVSFLNVGVLDLVLDSNEEQMSSLTHLSNSRKIQEFDFVNVIHKNLVGN